MALRAQAAMKAEAATIVATARRDQEERIKAQEAAKNVKTSEELQALINSRLKSSMASRPPVVPAQQTPSPASSMNPATAGTPASVKAEAAVVVAAAQRERDELKAAQKAAKNANPEELQAIIASRLGNRSS